MTLQQFALVVSSVLGVFLVMGVGALCRTRHWLTREADVSLAKITANVLLPALFLDRILNDPALGSLSTAWLAPAIGFTFTTLGYLTALWFARWLGPWFGLSSDAQQRAFAVCAGICNYGYIPLPLAQIFFREAEVDLILHNVGVDLSLWSVGVAIISGGATEGEATPNQTHGKERVFALMKPIFTSAPLIAVVFALGIRSVSGESWLPAAVLRTVSMLAATSIPMGLILSGAIIVDFLKAARWEGALRVISMAIGFRQVFMPLLMLTFAAVALSRTDLKQVLMLQAAMPSAVFPIVLVRMYQGDTATALRIVLSTHLAGLLLIPLWMAIGAWWLGVEINV